MTVISAKKLLNSKWTAVRPTNKEKHFLITKVKYDEQGLVILCEIEAVYTQRVFAIDWQGLKDPSKWQQGWA